MRNLTVYQRFAMIIAALTMVLFAVSALQILVLRDATLDERRTTVRNLVEAATKVLAHYEGEAKAGRIEPDKARQMAFAAISAMRWGEYSDYIGVYGTGSADAGVTYVHANPKYINVNRWDFKDKSGKLLIQDIVRTARAGGGFVEYLAPRSAGGAELRKVSYVGAFGAGDKASGASGGRLCRRYRRRGVSPDDLGRDRRIGRAGHRGIRGVLAWPRPGRSPQQDLLGDGRTGQGQSCGRHSVRRPDQRGRPDCAKPAGLQGSSGRNDAAPHRAGSDEAPVPPERRTDHRPVSPTSSSAASAG